MAFRKIYDGLRLIAKALGTSSKLGEIEAIDADSNGEGIVTLHDGDSASQILTAEHQATVSNKTLDDSNVIDGAQIIDPDFEAEELTLKEITSPANPAAGEHKLYINEDNNDLELKNSSGNITKFVEQAQTSANIVYGTDALEDETTIPYSSGATSNYIIQRDSNGSAKVETLSDSDMSAEGQDITNRLYVRRKVIVDSNDTTATEGGSLSISTNTNSNVYYIGAASDLNSYTINLPNLKDNVDSFKAYEYSFIFSTTINSLSITTAGGSSLNFSINHAQAGDSFSVVFDNTDNIWYLKNQYSRDLNNVQAEHLSVRLLDDSSTSLPTGSVAIDGDTVIVEDVVLFTALSSDPGIYRAKGTIGDDAITGWDQVSCFRGVGSPVAGDEVFVRAGTVYANTLHTYDGSSWSDTSTNKADTDLGNLTSTSINQDLLPDTTLTRDLGSSSKSWIDVWVERLLAPLGSSVTVATEDATSSTNSNNVTVTSGATVDGTSGQMTAKSGDTSGNGSSNFATFRSGNITGTSSSGNSGLTTVRSGNVTGASSTGDSGTVVVKSGDVSGSGDSGNVAIYSGSSAGGSRGAVNLQGNGILLDSLGQGVNVDNDNIINVADPVNAQDAATKNYTDTLVENPTIEVATFNGQSSTPTNPSAGNYKVYVDDNTQKLTILDSSGNAKQIGSGSGGGINYIENPDAEVNTDGWATYADAASTSPVDGTGGSPNITWTRSTSSPLRGDASFLFTKDAANRQGEGASYDFTIDSADQAKVMQIAMDYAIASGTYATGDLTCYIVDVTNGTVIQPSAFQIENVGVNSTTRLTFQTASNSTSYRLCFHVASTSASAYSLKFDNIQLGPQVVPMGAPVTDWVSYTPTLSWVSNATASALWRRVGDTLYVTGRVTTSGAPTAADLTISIPSGLSIDTAKVVSTTRLDNLGEAGVRDDSGTALYDGLIRYASATTVAVLGQQTSGTTYSVINATAPFTWAANDTVTFEFSVPIVGWSSSTVVSSSADTRVVAVSIPTGAATGTVSAAFNNVTFTGTEVVDTHGAFNGTTFTAPVPGNYNVTARLEISHASVAVGNSIYAAIYKNGSLYGANIYRFSDTGFGAASVVVGPLVVPMNATDTITIRSYSNGTTPSLTTSLVGNSLSINLIQGPSQIAASEVVAWAGRSSAGTSIGTSTTTIPFATTDFDTHGAYSSGTFTVPAPGKYEVEATIAFSSQSWTVGSYVDLRIVINGSSSRIVKWLAPRSATLEPDSLTVRHRLDLKAGDTISFGASQNETGSGRTLAANAAYNFASISRLGGV